MSRTTFGQIIFCPELVTTLPSIGPVFNNGLPCVLSEDSFLTQTKTLLPPEVERLTFVYILCSSDWLLPSLPRSYHTVVDRLTEDILWRHRGVTELLFWKVSRKANLEMDERTPIVTTTVTVIIDFIGLNYLANNQKTKSVETLLRKVRNVICFHYLLDWPAPLSKIN